MYYSENWNEQRRKRKKESKQKKKNTFQCMHCVDRRVLKQKKRSQLSETVVLCWWHSKKEQQWRKRFKPRICRRTRWRKCHIRAISIYLSFVRCCVFIQRISSVLFGVFTAITAYLYCCLFACSALCTYLCA